MPVPIEFLLTASKISLHDFELSRLNHVAMLKKRFREMLDEMVEETAGAMVANLLLNDSRILADPRQGALEFMPLPPCAAQTPQRENGRSHPSSGESDDSLVSMRG